MDGVQLLTRWLRFLPGLLASVLLIAPPAGCGKKYSSGSEDAEVTADASNVGVDGGTGICGDGNLDPGEECDDGNQQDDDECLPGCTWACGDGVVNAVELCDTGIAAGQPGACPTGCDDSNACTTDTLVGSTCLAECVHGDISTCADDDGCCPSACNETSDNDCSAQCDNGVIEPGETCDPISSCPTTCDDQNTCTADSMAGDPSTCDAVCTNTSIAACTGGDGCCPAGCDNTTDTDCSANCGNSVLEAGETCDPPGTCPTSCDDNDFCTTDTMTGSAANCNVDCSNPVISSCNGGDGCCPGNCNQTNDSDCSASCGNSVVEVGEDCDDGNSDPTDGCDNCVFVTGPTVYRLTDLDLRDPHVHIYALWACRDLTDTSFWGFSVNGELQTAVQTDDDGDGELDMSFLLIMRPLDQSVPGGANMDIAMGVCTAPMGGTVCDLDPSFTPQASPYLNLDAGTCLDSIPGTTDGHTPPITAPGPICFYNTSLLTITLNMGGILIPLEDVQFGATYVGSPAADLNNGLLRGFISETNADNTILPASLPLIGGDTLSSVLPGGTGNCAGYDARDNNGGTVGWWFYLNWPATEVTYIGP